MGIGFRASFDSKHSTSAWPLWVAIAIAVLLSGCAHVSQKLDKSVNESIEVVQYCNALTTAFPIEEDELRTRLANVIRSRIIGRYCVPVSSGAAQTAVSLSMIALVSPRDCDRSLIEDHLLDLRTRLKSFEGTLRVSEDKLKQGLQESLEALDSFRAAYTEESRYIETEIDDTMEKVQGLKTCHGLACGRKIELAMAQHLTNIEATLTRVAADAQKLRAKFAVLRESYAFRADLESLYGEGAMLASASALFIDEGRHTVRDLMKDPYIRAAMKQHMVSQELYRFGGRLMTAIEKGIEPVDTLVDKVDQKAWFVGTLTVVWEEGAINKTMDRLSAKILDSKHTNLMIRAAIARSACDRWLGSSAVDQLSTTGNGRSSLTAPFLYRLFMQVRSDLVEELENLGQHATDDFAKNLLLASAVSQSPGFTISDSVPADIQASAMSRNVFLRLANTTQPELIKAAFATEQNPQKPSAFSEAAVKSIGSTVTYAAKIPMEKFLTEGNGRKLMVAKPKPDQTVSAGLDQSVVREILQAAFRDTETQFRNELGVTSRNK